MTQIGPWRLRGELGRGGMGVVYAASHVQTGQGAAVKTVWRPKAMSLHSMRREIETLAALQHPGVVQILDHGVTPDGIPWYAMEHLRGQTLRSARLGRRRSLTVLRQVCETLAWLHGEGVVHGDLKPDNIFLREDETPVLVDFGLRGAYAGGREAVSLGDNLLAGTAMYTAPEQIQGKFMDARADLYSLGCILFEQLTGRPPFEGEVWQLVEAHRMTPAPSARSVSGDVPVGLSQLTASLLRKEPRERIGHAQAVGRVLARYGASPPGKALPSPRPYLYRPGLRGRDEQWQVLADLVERIDGPGPGGLAIVRGPAGIGKTRLVNEAVREGKLHAMWILASACSPEATAPLSGFRGALRRLGDICREGGEETAKWLLGHRAPLLALHEPSLRGLPGVNADALPEELPESAARLRRFSYVAEALERLTEQDGAVVVLDDLQWADRETLVLLHFLRRAGLFERRPLLVVASLRSDVELPMAAQRLWEAPETVRLELAPLSEPDVRGMVEDMLGVTGAPDDVVRHLVERSEGNPLFVTEFVRSLINRTHVQRDDEGRWAVTESTATLARAHSDSSLQDLVVEHLGNLSAPARMVACLAALDGLVDQTVLRRALPTASRIALSETAAARQLEDSLRELVRAEILDVGEAGEFVFAHWRLRELARGEVGAEEAPRLHAALAAAMEAGAGDPARLALHLENSGQPEKARAAHLEAARRAIDAYAPGRAEKHLQRFLEQADMGTEVAVRARLDLAVKCLAAQGQRGEAQETLAATLVDAEKLGKPALTARVLWRQAAVMRRAGQPEEAMRALERARTLLEEEDDREVRAHVYNSLAIGHRLAGENEDCRELLVQAVNIYRMLGDGYGEGIALGNLALRDLDEGRFIESQRRNERAVMAFRADGRRLYEGIAIHNLGSIAQELGDDESAAALFARALDLHRETGDRRTKVLTLVRLSSTDMRRGAVGNCRRHLDRAIELFEALDDPHVAALVHLQRARVIRLLDGDPAGAAEACAEAIRGAELAGARAARLMGACERGHIALARRESGRPELHDAEGIGVGAQKAGEVVRRLGDLRAAVMAGPGACYRGALVESLPPAIVRHFTLTDPLFPAARAHH